MSIRDKQLLQQMAAQGNIDAALILEMIEATRRIPEYIDGITLAMGIKSDTDEILNGAMEDMMAELLPVMLKMSGAWALPTSGGFDSLRWGLSIQQMLNIAIFNHKRFHQGKEPLHIVLSSKWKPALDSAPAYIYQGVSVHLKYVNRRDTSKLDCIAEGEEVSTTTQSK